MPKNLPTLYAAMFTIISFAAVDANKATAAELEGIEGIGIASVNKIVDEREKLEAKIVPDLAQNSNNKINNINSGVPNRISMNVTVPKQTQGATFGERTNIGNINIVLNKEECLVLFSSDIGYKININDKIIKSLSVDESAAYGEKINQGLHATGGMLSQGASLLGGALPGGAIISAAVSSVSNLAGGAGGGAAAASYARTGRQLWKLGNKYIDSNLDLSEGDYELVFVIAEKMNLAQKNLIKTQVRIDFSIVNGVLKTKHDTAKNSVGNIR